VTLLPPALWSLSPLAATALFVIAVLAGVNYRRAWKTEAPRWRLWLFGGVAGACLLALGFLPLETG
jgi:hypothetical protein